MQVTHTPAHFAIPMKLLLTATAILSLSIATLQAVDITAQGSTISVAAGKAEVPGKSVTIAAPATLTIAPASIQSVADEALKLSTDKPAGFSKGTRLRGCNAHDVNAAGSLVGGGRRAAASRARR